MRTIVLLWAALGAVMLVPVAGWADSEVFLDAGGGSISFQASQVPANTTISIQGFNPALGTLDEVDCLNCSLSHMPGNATVTQTFLNPNPFTEGFEDEEWTLNIDIRTPSGGGWISGADELVCPVGPLDPGASMQVTCLGFGWELDSNSVSPTDLASFITTGNVFAPLSLGLPPRDDGNIVTFDSLSMDLGVDIVYGYTPIPELASRTMLLTAIVVAILCLCVKRLVLSQWAYGCGLSRFGNRLDTNVSPSQALSRHKPEVRT